MSADNPMYSRPKRHDLRFPLGKSAYADVSVVGADVTPLMLARLIKQLTCQREMIADDWIPKAVAADFGLVPQSDFKGCER